MVSKHPHLLAQEAYDRGMEHCQRGQKRSALSCFQETVRHHPQRWDALMECGRIHMDFKEFECAAADFAAAAAIRPDFAEAHAWLGSALAQAGRHADALAPLS